MYAIVYLLRTTYSDIIDIIKSLKSLKLYFLQYFDYPVIIFVEDNFSEEYKNIIKNNIDFNINFELIKFKGYDEINKDKNIEKILITHNGNQKWPLGYRNMCRFWSGDFLNNKIIEKYKYIWRMDSDAFLHEKVDYDLFKNMEDNDIVYNYSNICDDDEEVCIGLYDFSKKFFNENNIEFSWDLYKMFTTHVEIINTDVFKNSIYYDFYNKIDETNNFYIYRWGDAPIRYITMKNLKMKINKMDIKYSHGNDGSGRREQLLQKDYN
jgi:hypothetical protein